MGRYFIDWAQEHERLIDDSCGAGILMDIPEEVKGRLSLERATEHSYPGLSDRLVTGTFVGVFRWEPKGYPDMVLRVQSMSDFTVTRLRKP